MKSLKIAAFAAMMCALFFCVVIYSSCQKQDECFAADCKNGAACSKGICQCPAGYEGIKCEIKNLCYNVHCVNGGTCSGGKCACPLGYEGVYCGSETRSKFANVWDATDKWGIVPVSYKITTLTSKDSVTALDLGNTFCNGRFRHSVRAIVKDSTTVTIARQNPDQDSTFVTGEGKMTALGKMDWKYTITRRATNGDIITEDYTGNWTER